MDSVILINRIENAFDGSPRAETSMRQFQLTDKYGMSREITFEEWEAAGAKRVDLTWQEIPDDEIEECDCLLAHMGPEEYRYYLAAYMRYGVKNIFRPIWETDVLGMTISSLSPTTDNEDMHAYALNQYSGLNPPQRHAVIQFLEFVAKLEHDVRHADAQKALTNYWAQHP